VLACCVGFVVGTVNIRALSISLTFSTRNKKARPESSDLKQSLDSGRASSLTGQITLHGYLVTYRLCAPIGYGVLVAHRINLLSLINVRVANLRTDILPARLFYVQGINAKNAKLVEPIPGSPANRPPKSISYSAIRYQPRMGYPVQCQAL